MQRNEICLKDGALYYCDFSFGFECNITSLAFISGHSCCLYPPTLRPSNPLNSSTVCNSVYLATPFVPFPLCRQICDWALETQPSTPLLLASLPRKHNTNADPRPSRIPRPPSLEHLTSPPPPSIHGIRTVSLPAGQLVRDAGDWAVAIQI